MIKISFSGFSGSGKTALLNEVKKILSLKYKVEYCDEANDKNPFDESQKSSFVSQFFCFSSQINEENIRGMAMMDFLLCDQSVLDYWVYWNSFIRDMRDIKNIEMAPYLREKNTILETMYRFWIKSYDLIFWIRVDLKELGKRELPYEWNTMQQNDIKRMEELYQETVIDSDVKIIEIWNNKSIDESAHEIIKHIYSYKDKETAADS